MVLIPSVVSNERKKSCHIDDLPTDGSSFLSSYYNMLDAISKRAATDLDIRVNVANNIAEIVTHTDFTAEFGARPIRRAAKQNLEDSALVEAMITIQSRKYLASSRNQHRFQQRQRQPQLSMVIDRLSDECTIGAFQSAQAMISD